MKLPYILLAFIITLVSCHEKKYKYTRKVPNSSLYEEMFTSNSLGLYHSYLTDSVSFRTYIGEIDLEHDYFIYVINKERIQVKKVSTGNKNCRWVITNDGHQTILCDTEVVDLKSLNLSMLKQVNKKE
jgi:hypothetical protein